MPRVLLPTRWTQQPQVPVEIDWSNPITQGLVAAFDPSSGKNLRTNNNFIAPTSISKYGKNYLLNSTQIYTSGDISNTVLDIYSSWTVCVRVVINENFVPTSNQQIISLRWGNYEQFIIKITYYAGTYRYDTGNHNGSTTYNTGSGNANLGESKYIVGTFNGSTVTQYLNAKFLSSASLTPYTQAVGPKVIIIGSGSVNVSVSDILVFNRAISASEVASLSSNPWQIFAPSPSRLYMGVTGIQVDPRYARPSSDISTGAWTPSTGSTLYNCIDESTYSDADYILTSSASTCEIGLWPVQDPYSSSGQVLRFRAQSTSGSTLVATLKQGATTIATRTYTGVASSWTDYTMTLTSGECDSITDYSALSVTLAAS